MINRLKLGRNVLLACMLMGVGSAAVADPKRFETSKAQETRLIETTKPSQETEVQLNRTVASGISTPIHSYTMVRPDCSNASPTVLRVLKKPQHGEIAVNQVEDFVNFPESNAVYKCTHEKKVPAVQISYRSTDDFFGQDEFTVLAIFPTGMSRTQVFNVDVR
jgi:hypothetical protein